LRCFYSGGFVTDAVFDPSTGLIDIQSAGNTAIATSVGNGWWRLSVTYTLPASGVTTTGIGLYIYDSAGANYTGDGTSGLYLWGAQLELGANASSYVPTVAAAVTRAADVAQITGAAFSAWYNQTEGTFYAAGILPDKIGTHTLIAAKVAASTDYITLRSTTVNANSTVVSGNVQQALLSAVGAVANTNSLAITSAYKLDDFAASVNGSAVLTDTSGAVPVNPVLLDIGKFNATNYLNGWVRKVSYWNTRLPDNQVQTLSVGGNAAFYNDGLPFNANGSMVVQTDTTPAPYDPYDHGIRVGDNGVYLTTGAPPVVLSGFDSGFDGGFGT
jgi:hypothetical protein